MATLDKEIKIKVDKYIEEAMGSFNPNKIEDTINILKKAWELLPEPKTSWMDSFLISKYITHVYFNANKFDEALEWAEIFNNSDPGRDYGESEFMLAKVQFKKELKDDAFKNFEIAEKKSDGRVWKGEKDMEYFKFYKSYDK